MLIKVRLIFCMWEAEGIITFQVYLLKYSVSLYCAVYSKTSEILLFSSFISGPVLKRTYTIIASIYYLVIFRCYCGLAI